MQTSSPFHVFVSLAKELIESFFSLCHQFSCFSLFICFFKYHHQNWFRLLLTIWFTYAVRSRLKIFLKYFCGLHCGILRHSKNWLYLFIIYDTFWLVPGQFLCFNLFPLTILPHYDSYHWNHNYVIDLKHMVWYNYMFTIALTL